MENDLASSAVILCGSDHLKKKFLTRLIEEPLMASCVTETGAGSVVAEAEANAEKKDSAMGQEEGSYADIAMDRVKVSCIDSATDIDAVSRKLTEVFRYAYAEGRKEFENYVKIHHTSEFENYVGKVRACWQKQGSGLKIDDCIPSSEFFRGFVFIGDGEYAGRCIPIESLE
ncbi:hypothetical protein DdX_12539 [Ditylenchus destructor]|uniref:Uncharacterized protein n=1 Tax=Ditylenchus destructor TaxID=166010 RepID=A0AAD4MXY2_9BILA|nr:hypothetical protein DdX_12539 [Ditylenchus destructor]